MTQEIPNVKISDLPPQPNPTATSELALAQGGADFKVQFDQFHGNTKYLQTGFNTTTSDQTLIGVTLGLTVITLGIASQVNGRLMEISDETGQASINPVIIEAEGGALINGVSDFKIGHDYGRVKVYWNGTQWILIPVQPFNYRFIAGNYLTNDDSFILAAPATSGIVITLSARDRFAGRTITIKHDGQPSGLPYGINAEGGGLIDGSASTLVRNNIFNSVTLMAGTGNEWFITSNYQN